LTNEIISKEDRLCKSFLIPISVPFLTTYTATDVLANFHLSFFLTNNFPKMIKHKEGGFLGRHYRKTSEFSTKIRMGLGENRFSGFFYLSSSNTTFSVI
jgi:hypothetical protein